MRIGIMGTGTVGRTLGAKLVDRGHQVMLGSRTRDNARAAEWVAAVGQGASQGTFADAAASGEALFNCTGGMVSLQALEAAGEDNLAGKILIDVANPLDFSHGMPPTLSVCNSDSLAEQIQRRFPRTHVIKSLNTMTAALMVEPTLVPAPHNVFVSGDDERARRQVAGWLTEWFEWPRASIVDLGELASARGTEMLLPLWLRLYRTFGSATFNFHVAGGGQTG